MHYLSSVYFVNQPLHVSDIFVAHHKEVYYIYIYIYNDWYVLCFQLTVCWLGRDGTEFHLDPSQLYIYSIPPDDGLQICPKHVEVD